MVMMFKIPNLLKKKLGLGQGDHPKGGRIDPRAVEEADALIQSLCEDCSSSIASLFKEMTDVWAQMSKIKDVDQRGVYSERIYMLAHEIKDISSMCGYDLIAFFSESLRDYVGQSALSLDAQKIIIQAHIDAINLAHKQGIKEDGGAAAEELKRLVKVAIQKYS